MYADECARIIGLRVRLRRQQRLRIDVEAMGFAGAEPRAGHREDSRSAAVVDHYGARLQMGIEPFEAQPGRRVCAGAERETGIHAHHECVRLAHLFVIRADPQALAEPHSVEVAQPFALPDTILHWLDSNVLSREAEMRTEPARQL